LEEWVEEVRSDIPFLRTGITYLDNAATTLTPEPVVKAMLEYYHEFNANTGRGLHKATKRATEAFESSREKISRTISSKPKEVAYTKNTTESLNLIARSLNLERGDKVIATFLEHHSNLIPWQRLEEEKGIELEIVKEHSDLVIKPQAIEEAIDERTKLVTMPYTSNAFGTDQPVKEVGKIAEENDVLFSIDAAQAVGHRKIDVDRVKCDFLAAPGHKGLLGPPGTGFLYIREDHLSETSPLLYGGGVVESVTEHECKLIDPPQVFDGGTPNIPGVIGMGRGAEYVLDIGLDKIERRERKLVGLLLRMGDEEDIQVYGPKTPEKLGGIVSFGIEGMDSHEVSSILDETGNIATRSGHQCAQPAMTYLDIVGNVRASVHCYNTGEEIEALLKILYKLI